MENKTKKENLPPKRTIIYTISYYPMCTIILEKLPFLCLLAQNICQKDANSRPLMFLKRNEGMHACLILLPSNYSFQRLFHGKLEI